MFDAKGGEGSSMIDLGGATYLGELSYYIRLYITFGVFMCDTLLCIHRVFTFMH